MNITLEQYNTVINGVRTQLELHVKFQEDLKAHIKTLTELNDLKDIEIKEKRGQLDAIKKELEILHGQFRSKVAELKRKKK